MKNPYDKKPELSTFADVDRLSYENLCADASSHAFCAPIISFVSGELFMDAVDRIHLRNTIVSLKDIQGFYFPGFPCRSPLLHYDISKKQDNKNRQVVTTWRGCSIFEARRILCGDNTVQGSTQGKSELVFEKDGEKFIARRSDTILLYELEEQQRKIGSGIRGLSKLTEISVTPKPVEINYLPTNILWWNGKWVAGTPWNWSRKSKRTIIFIKDSIFDSLSELEEKVCKETMMSLVHIARYVTRKDALLKKSYLIQQHFITADRGIRWNRWTADC